VPFLNTPDQTLVESALVGIRKLERRQGDAETMLQRGDFPLGFLGRMDLTLSTSLCDKARAFLRKRVEPLVLKTPNSKPYLTALVWLAGHGCEAEPELSEAEEVVRAYKDSPQRAAMLATLEKLHRK
jgi:hypothetical protein